MTEWFTTEGATPEEEEAAQNRLVLAWRDAPLESPEVCQLILDVAREQVIAYAPDPGTAEAAVAAVLGRFGLEHHLTDVLAILELDDLTDPPRRYVYAQLQQARNLWEAGRVNQNGEVGAEGFSFIPRPLDKTIRSIIRPMDGKPHVL
jgi:hypothetical protein